MSHDVCQRVSVCHAVDMRRRAKPLLHSWFKERRSMASGVVSEFPRFPFCRRNLSFLDPQCPEHQQGPSFGH